MCGIAGLWQEGLAEDGAARIASMTDAVAQRGPDDRGIYVDSAAGLALGHRRLSILDLSERGRQPMTSRSGRYVVTYNGEIYNFRRLKSELEGSGQRFETQSDTEVLLAAVERWGLDGAVERFVGMFAFGLWDRHERTLHLVRDRLGVKPLYYACKGQTLWFGSELGVLRADREFDRSVDAASLVLLAQFSFIPDPWTIHTGARKLPPGCILTLRSPGADAEPRRYWDAARVARDASARRIESLDEGLEELAALLDDSVDLRMISDVPLGAFLSGGIDSSLVVAWMQRLSDQPVRTFTIGYEDTSYDESVDARRVAEHLGTEHHELRLDTAACQEVIRDLPDVYDEPFADASQVPTLLVSRFARQHVTVVLTGDGGDELFVGYNRHVWGERASRIIENVPRGLRLLGQRILDGAPTETWDRAISALGTMLPARARVRMPGDKIAKLAALLDARDSRGVYESLVSYNRRARELAPHAPRRRGPLEELVWHDDLPFAEAAALEDARAFLPGDPLVKVDRATMSVGLEAREPLLDHRIAELAWRLPIEMKVRDGVGKWILRELLARHVPRSLFERPKMGFGVPIDDWLRNGLRDWAEDLLSTQALRDTAVFDPVKVRELWQSHLSGHRNVHVELWAVLMTQAWLQRHSLA